MRGGEEDERMTEDRRRRGDERSRREDERRCNFNALISDLASLPSTLSAVTTTNLLRS